MNQPNLPMMTPKAAPAAEGLDPVALLRRYVWLLIGGALTGAAISAAAYVYEQRTNPEYTARVPFVVLDRQAPIGFTDLTHFNAQSIDDYSQIIHRQEYLFTQESFLTSVLKLDEFHKDGQDTLWLRENKKDPIKALKRDLKIMPQINAGTFDVTMRTHNADESYTLVRGIVREYIDTLKRESANRSTAYMDKVQQALNERQKQFDSDATALAQYAATKGIDVMRSRFEVEKAALQGLNEEYMKADAIAAGAEAQYSAIKKMTEDGKPLTTDMLTPEMRQYIDNDPTLRSLQGQRMGWEQELAAERSKPSPNKQRIGEIDARMKEIDDQEAVTRKKLETDALKRMADAFENDAVNKRAIASHINEGRSKKEELVRSLGQDLMAYQNRVDDLKKEQETLFKLKEQYDMISANRNTDDTRVQQLDEPVVPYKPSWPQWYVFVPLGTMAGLGLSALLAYLLVLTDTRVRTPRDISRTLQLPLLGFVPDEGDDRMLSGEVETAILTSPASMVAESFRHIRSQITAQTAHNPANSVLVASITPGGGATTVASNFAAAMALNDLRVLLVDANLYRPSFGRVFKDMPKEGLTDLVAHPELAATAIVPHGSLPSLHLLGAGSNTANISSLFESKAFRETFEQLKGKYDLIVFDGAPLNLVSDSLALGARVDGVVPVVRAGEVSRGMVNRVRDQLRGVHANLMGFVLNAAQTSSTGYFKENYRTFYRYAGSSRGPSA